jgi:hypothetical protein
MNAEDPPRNSLEQAQGNVPQQLLRDSCAAQLQHGSKS